MKSKLKRIAQKVAKLRFRVSKTVAIATVSLGSVFLPVAAKADVTSIDITADPATTAQTVVSKLAGGYGVLLGLAAVLIAIGLLLRKMGVWGK